MDFNQIVQCIKEFSPNRDNLGEMLHRIQNMHPEQYIPGEAIAQISLYTKIPVVEILGTISFYNMFSLQPRGKYIIRVCKSYKCDKKESDLILKELLTHYNISEAGQTSQNKLITIDSTECLGKCKSCSAVSINNEYIKDVNHKNVITLVEKYIQNKNLVNSVL